MGVLCTSKHLKPNHINLNCYVFIIYFHQKGKQSYGKYMSFLFYNLLEINEIELSFHSGQGLCVSREEGTWSVQVLLKDSAVVVVGVSKTPTF